MVFGEKSERTKKKYDAPGTERAQGRGNGSKPRRKGTGKRRDLSHLPVIDEIVEVAAEQGRCPRCGKEYVLHGHEESELVELQVEVYRRRIQRQRKRPVCGCSEAVEAVAPAVNRLFAGSRYGISVWGMYLFQRFAMHQTVGGFGRMSEAFGLPLSASTLVSRNASFLSMFGPLFNAIREHQSEAWKVHGDETGWPIQVAGVRDGEHYRGWLWVCVSADSVSMHIDRSRSAAAGMVLFERFGQRDSPPVAGVRPLQRLSEAVQGFGSDASILLGSCTPRFHPMPGVAKRNSKRGVSSGWIGSVCCTGSIDSDYASISRDCR